MSISSLPALTQRLEAMLAAGQDNALLRFSLGQAYLKDGQHDIAIAHLSRALEHNRTYSAAWKLLAQAQSHAGQRAQAIETYTQGIAVAEENGDIQAGKEMRVFMRRLARSGE